MRATTGTRDEGAKRSSARRSSLERERERPDDTGAKRSSARRSPLERERERPGDIVSTGLHRLQRLLSSRRVASKLAETAGVDLAQQAIEVLRVLGDGEARPVADVARAAHMDLGAVSRQLTSLEERRLVRRRAGANGGPLVAATAAGRKIAARVDAVRSRHLEDVFADWEPRERDEFGRLLVRFVDALARTPYRAE